MAGDWRSLSVRLEADTGPYTRGLQTAATETSKFTAQTAAAQSKMSTGWKGTEQGLRGVDDQLKRTEAQMVKTGTAGTNLRASVAGLAVGIGLRKVIGEYEEAEKVGNQTNAVIRSTGNAAQVSAAQQEVMVASLSKLAAMDDEVVAGGANLLRTFTQIRGAETFEGALRAAVDLSAAMGTDLQGNVILVGKALNDPVKGLTALTRAGVSFTASQKETIKSMVQTGDVAGAQKLILAELSAEFGGSAAANATNSAKMKVAFDDAAESLGGALAPALGVAATAVGFLSGEFQRLPAGMQAAIAIGLGVALMGGKIASAWEAVGTSFATARAAMLADVTTPLTGMTAGVESLTVANEGLTASEYQAAAGAQAQAAGMSLVTASLVAVVAGYLAYKETLSTLDGLVKFHGDTVQLAEDLKALGDGTGSVDAIFGQFGGSAASLAGELKVLDETATQSGLETMAEGVVSFVSKIGVVPALLGSVQKSGHDASLQAQNDVKALDSELTKLAKGSPAEAEQAFRLMVAALMEQGATTEEITRAFPQYTGKLGEAKAANEAAGVAALSHADRQKILAGALDLTSGSLQEQAGKAKSVFDSWQAVSAAADAINQSVVAVADAQAGERDAQRSHAEAITGVSKANRDLASARRAVGEAEAQVAAARDQVAAAERGVTDALKDEATAQEAVVTAQADLALRRREATGDSDAMRSALAGVVTAEENLATAQQQSLSDQEALERARANYGQTLLTLADQAGGAVDAVTTAEIRLRAAQEAAKNLGKGQAEALADAQAAIAALGPDATAAQIAAAEKALRRAQEAMPSKDDQIAAAIAIREAQRRLNAAKLEAAAAQALYNKEEQAGVNGSTAVVAAQEQVNASKRAEVAAHDALVKAVGLVAATQIEADAAVGKAERELNDKIDGVNAAHQRTIDARGAVQDAHEGVRKAVQGVADANQTVADKQAAVQAANDKVVSTADAIVTAHGKVKTAVDNVGKAQADAATKAYELDLKTQGAEKANKNLRDRLIDLIPTLDPNSSLYKNLSGYVKLLQLQADLEAKNSKPPSTSGSIFGFLDNLPGGSNYPNRWGGVVTAYARGGIHAHVQKGEAIRYAEPETGGEAYVPRLGDRTRSMAVLNEAAGWYGMGLIEKGKQLALGGLLGGSVMDQTTAAAAAHTSTGGFDVFAVMSANIAKVQAATVATAATVSDKGNETVAGLGTLAMSADLTTAAVDKSAAQITEGLRRIEVEAAYTLNGGKGLSAYESAQGSVYAATSKHAMDADKGAAWNTALANLFAGGGKPAPTTPPTAQWKVDSKQLAKDIAAAIPNQGPLVNVEQVNEGVGLAGVMQAAEFAAAST